MPGCNQQAARVRETLATVNFSPKGLINKANCTAAEENSTAHWRETAAFQSKPQIFCGWKEP